MTERNVIERHLEEIDVIRDLIIVTCVVLTQNTNFFSETDNDVRHGGRVS